MDAGIDTVAPIAVRPAVKATIDDRREVVRHEVTAELVALVDHRPECAGLGLPYHTVRVAQPARDQTFGPGLRIDFPDSRASLLRKHAVLACIAVRANSHVQMLAVAARQQILGPVVIDTGRQIDHLYADRRVQAGCAATVVEADDRL